MDFLQLTRKSPETCIIIVCQKDICVNNIAEKDCVLFSKPFIT